MTKITLIGAGSTSFGWGMVQDLVAHAADLAGTTIVLNDLDAASLELMLSAARGLARAATAQLHFEATTDLRAALEGTQFVIISVAVDRLATWQRDWEIPRRHGVRQVLGENGGPGGLGHTLRSVQTTMNVARVIEEVAPQALVLNFTNPMSRICLALARASQLRVVGLCHQIGAAYRIAGQVLGLVATEEQARNAGALLHQALDIKAAGLNHMTFIYDIRDAITGADRMPEFLERLAHMPAEFEPLSRRILEAFGMFPATGDGHVGEYFGYAWETSAERGYDFTGRVQHATNERQRLGALLAGSTSFSSELGHISGERAIPIISAILHNRNQYELAVNIPNHGCIAGLPDWAIVEVPGLVSGAGVAGVHVPQLPAGILSVLAQQIAVQDRAVEAALYGDRQAALQALLLDPTTTSYAQSKAILDELLEAHAAYLPLFAQ